MSVGGTTCSRHEFIVCLGPFFQGLNFREYPHNAYGYTKLYSTSIFQDPFIYSIYSHGFSKGFASVTRGPSHGNQVTWLLRIKLITHGYTLSTSSNIYIYIQYIPCIHIDIYMYTYVYIYMYMYTEGSQRQAFNYTLITYRALGYTIQLT